MSVTNTISLSVLMNDLFSSKLKLLQGKSDSFFNNWKTKMNKAEAENKEFKLSIDQINTELDRLTKLRKISVDASQLKSVNAQIEKLSLQKTKMETMGTGSFTASKSSLGMGALGMLGGAGLAIGAVYGAGRFASSSIDEYNQSAQTEAQLKAGLTSTGGISGKTLSELKAQANELAGTTLFEDDVTGGAQKILLTFTKIRGVIYDEAVPAIQDMATKMNMDLSDAALQVGKALNDPILGVTALRRQGVQLTKTQEKQIKTFVALGQQEKAQAIILKELNTEFGGSAEAAAKAGTGGFTILANKMKDFKEAVGERMTSGLGGLSKGLGKVVDTATKWMEIPLSEKMEDERMKVIVLGNRISDTNIPMTERNKLYDELKSIAPEVLTGIDKESIAYGKLKDNLQAYNEQASKKIFLSKKEEDIKDITNEAGERFSYMMTNKEDWQTMAAEFAEKNTVLNAQLSGKIQSILGQNITTEKKYYEVMKLAVETDKTATGDLSTELMYFIANSKALYGTYFHNIEKYGNLNSTALKLEKKYNEFVKTLGFNTESTSTSKLIKGKGDDTDPYGITNMNGDISKVKNITITINRLIGIENITTSTIMENMSKVEDAVKQVLLTAVNDANLAGRN